MLVLVFRRNLSRGVLSSTHLGCFSRVSYFRADNDPLRSFASIVYFIDEKTDPGRSEGWVGMRTMCWCLHLLVTLNTRWRSSPVFGLSSAGCVPGLGFCEWRGWLESRLCPSLTSRAAWLRWWHVCIWGYFFWPLLITRDKHVFKQKSKYVTVNIGL